MLAETPRPAAGARLRDRDIVCFADDWSGDPLSEKHIMTRLARGRRPYAALPAYCKAFDVALLPFVKNELTENANPLKLREYLAAGLPVVSTDIPEAAALAAHGVWLAGAPDAFVARAREALAAGPGPDRARSESMARESWDHKVGDIENLLLELKP